MFDPTAFGANAVDAVPGRRKFTRRARPKPLVFDLALVGRLD